MEWEEKIGGKIATALISIHHNMDKQVKTATKILHGQATTIQHSMGTMVQEYQQSNQWMRGLMVSIPKIHAMPLASKASGIKHIVHYPQRRRLLFMVDRSFFLEIQQENNENKG